MDRAHIEVDPAGSIVTLKGEFDLSNTEQLRHCLDQFDEAVTLDMAGVTFIDSTGIAAIVTAFARGVRLKITNPSERAARVLELCGLSHFVVD